MTLSVPDTALEQIGWGNYQSKVLIWSFMTWILLFLGLTIAGSDSLFMSQTISLAVGAVIVGFLSEGFGRILLFKASILVYGTNFMFFYFEPWNWVRIPCSVLLGASMGAGLVMSLSILNESIPRSKYYKRGLLGVAMSLGVVIGNLVCGTALAMCCCAVIFVGCYCLSASDIYEGPVFLYMKRELQDYRECLVLINEYNGNDFDLGIDYYMQLEGGGNRKLKKWYGGNMHDLVLPVRLFFSGLAYCLAVGYLDTNVFLAGQFEVFIIQQYCGIPMKILYVFLFPSFVNKKYLTVFLCVAYGLLISIVANAKGFSSIVFAVLYLVFVELELAVFLNELSARDSSTRTGVLILLLISGVIVGTLALPSFSLTISTLFSLMLLSKMQYEKPRKGKFF